MILEITTDYVREFLTLVLWLHVFLAIIWVGLTAFFWVLESAFQPPVPGGDEPTEGVEGEVYWLHGGIFYFRKYRGGLESLPADVRWHPQWYAYGTWVTGFFLLCVVYYWKADAYLIDPSVARISPVTAISVSVSILAVGWLFYHRMSRALLRRESLLRLILFGFVVGVSFALSHLFSSGGLLIEVGAMLGTWMAGNVLFVWEPLHRSLYAARGPGKGKVDPELQATSWQRAQHNAYLAPPVLFAMLGSHFTFVTGARHMWFVLIVFMLVGGFMRYFFIRRQRGVYIWPIPAASAVVVVGLAVWLAPAGSQSPSVTASPAEIAAGRTVFATSGCGNCHTLKDAGTLGRIGPNLDQLMPSATVVVSQVTSGGGGMPPFGGRLSRKQINDVAAYVSSTAGR